MKNIVKDFEREYRGSQSDSPTKPSPTTSSQQSLNVDSVLAGGNVNGDMFVEKDEQMEVGGGEEVAASDESVCGSERRSSIETEAEKVIEPEVEEEEEVSDNEAVTAETKTQVPRKAESENNIPNVNEDANSEDSPPTSPKQTQVVTTIDENSNVENAQANPEENTQTQEEHASTENSELQAVEEDLKKAENNEKESEDMDISKQPDSSSLKTKTCEELENNGREKDSSDSEIESESSDAASGSDSEADDDVSSSSKPVDEKDKVISFLQVLDVGGCDDTPEAQFMARCLRKYSSARDKVTRKLDKLLATSSGEKREKWRRLQRKVKRLQRKEEQAMLKDACTNASKDNPLVKLFEKWKPQYSALAETKPAPIESTQSVANGKCADVTETDKNVDEAPEKLDAVGSEHICLISLFSFEIN